MNKISLLLYKMVLLPLPLFEKTGVNVSQLKLILRYKLMMDDRHPNTFQQTRGRPKKEGISNATIGTMIMAFVGGVLNLISFAIGVDDITHFSIFYLAFLFLLASILITDFTSVLIDVRDNIILLPRPVNDRTILMAKLMHIAVHLSRVIIPLTIPVLVFVLWNKGIWAGLSFLFLTSLAALFAIFLINAAYLLVLKIMSPEKFKSFIAWFQIGFVIFIYGGYQFFLKATDRPDFQQFSIDEYPFAKFFPPYWFAAAWSWMNGQLESMGIIWLVTSIAASLGSIWVVVKFLAPAFNARLIMIQGSGSDSIDLSLTKDTIDLKKRGQGIGEVLAKLVTGNATERAGFLFSWWWTGRNRGFRMRVYPTVGYVIVWIILILVRGGGSNTYEESSDFSNSAYGFLVFMYITSFIIINAIQNIHLADEFKSSWIFYSNPIKRPGIIIRGSFKSMLCKFYLPLAIILVVGGIAWKGWGIIPNLVLGLSNQLVICSIILLLGKKAFPASRPNEMNDRSGNFLRGLVMLVLVGVAAVSHYFVYKFTAVVLLLSVLSILAGWLLMKRIGNISWAEVNKSADE